MALYGDPSHKRPAGTWVPLQQPRHFGEPWLSQRKVPWGWGIQIMNICQRELGPSRIIHTQVSRLELPSSTQNQGLWSRYTEKWFRKKNVQDIYYAVNVKGQFLKIKYQNIFKVIYLFPSPLSPPFRYYFFFTWKLTSPFWRTLTSRNPHRCSSSSSSCQLQDSSAIYGHGKVSLPKKEKKEKWIKQIKLRVIPHHLPLHL